MGNSVLTGVFGNEATLLYEFADAGVLDAQQGGALITPSFTRSTADGGAFGSAGVMAFAASGVASFDHDPALNDKPIGYRQFPQYINEITESENFTDSDWANGGSPTESANSTVAPDGTTTADTIGDDNGAGVEEKRQDITVGNSETYTGYMHVLKDTDTTRFPALAFTWSGGSAINALIQINTQTGAAIDRLSGGSATFGVDDVGNYWRLWLTSTNDASGNTQLRYVWRPADGSTFGSFSAAATGETIIWGASLTQTAFPVPYVATTSAAVTVNASVQSPSTNTTWLTEGIGTLICKGRSARTSTAETLVRIGDDSADQDAIALSFTSGDQHQFLVEDGNTAQATMTDASNPVTQYSDFIAAGSWQANSFHHVANAAISDAEDTSGTIPANSDIDEIQIGDDEGGNEPFVGWISSIEYRQRQLSNAELDVVALPLPTFDWNPEVDQSLVTRFTDESPSGITLTMASGSAVFSSGGLALDASNTLTALTSLPFNHQNAMTCLIEGTLTSDLGADHVLLEISDGSAGFDNSRILLIETSSGDIEAVNEVNGTEDARATGVAVTNFTSAFKVAGRFALNNIQVGEGGGNGTADTANAIPYGATQSMTIGLDSAGARHCDMIISRVRIWGNVALPDGTLDDLTT